MPDSIKIYDRIKEITYTTGVNNFQLAGTISGFSSFDSQYQNNDNLFYAVTDGQNYEIGSGIFVTGVYNEIIRFPIRSSNSNSIVNFAVGIKEIYSTYPATHAVFHGSGIDGFTFPSESGIAFWSEPNTLNYSSNLTWDNTNFRIGIINSSPEYGIDIGGDARQSSIQTSGLYIGSSGIYFPEQNNGDSSYVGGRQLTHYEMNQLDQYAYDNALLGELTGTSSVFQLSGVVNQFLLFKEQGAGTFLAGPASGCAPPCSPGYPSFRTITCEDVPCIADVSGILRTDLDFISGVAIYASGESDYVVHSNPNDYSPTSGVVSGVYNIIVLDQAAYNALPKDPNTLYFIT